MVKDAEAPGRPVLVGSSESRNAGSVVARSIRRRGLNFTSLSEAV